MQVFLPDNAPFTEGQRAWLNGFIAGLLGMEQSPGAARQPATVPAAPAPLEDMPWHDPTLALDDRLKLAAGRPLELRLMAAMGQLDCGQCGYLCKTYSAAIATGAEADLAKCVPGGRATTRKLKELLAETGIARPVTAAAVPPRQPVERGYGRDVPVAARLSEARCLNEPGAEKNTFHVVIDLGDSAVIYEPGASLGVWPQNNPDEVELLLAILKAKGSEAVTLSDGAVTCAREALSRECDLRVPTDTLYELLAREARDAADRTRLARLAQDDAQADAFGVHDVLDTLMEFPSARPRVGDFAAALGRMQPRLYSIASSQRRHAREVHLTVAELRYERNERAYRGIASSFFSEYLRPGRPVSVFVQRTHGFRLPQDPSAAIIMIGPGTGIAPFRAFLQERDAAGHTGRNWLFFGNQRRATDFLYREELEDLAARRVLTRMDLAFSRDQASKVYVQHKMLDAAQELWRWLGNGAHLYVCGDATRMAGDVDMTLQQIAIAQGGMDTASARAWLAQLSHSGRYQRDVY